ncbi:Na/Pi cotransporter family protein [Poseidonocella sp. HB161398]|uniref:Na/Pi cotransporter family protein n=1 Tax=Poseidonocella sp. HB161398 TaxID=2320855 RepID=UPI0019822CBE|nr:Na/Pi cotransporter family protein [Poseidonocella sp. HB161398]
MLVTLNLCGAIALLLFGLSQIKSGIVEAFGAGLKSYLAGGTRTGPRAIVSGFGVTLALQSSTATALLAASFAERRLLDPVKGQLVMLGANLGTAVTAVIVSLHLGWISPLALCAGLVAGRGSTPLRRGGGRALTGLGLLLLSLELLDLAGAPLRSSAALGAFIALLDSAWIVALCFGGLLAFLSSSSLAAVMMIASISATGGLPPGLVLVLVLGANVGGAVPAVVASLGSSPEARRLTLGNLLARGGGAAVALLAVQAAGPLPAGGLVPGLPDALALHLAFNAALLLAAWPLSGAIAAMAARIVPDAPRPPEERPLYLAEDLLGSPVMALAGATREVLRIGDLAERMLAVTMESLRRRDPARLEEVRVLEKRIDHLQQEVKLYLARLLGRGMSDAESRRAIAIIDYAINLEHVGDIIEKGLAALVAKRARESVHFSEDGYGEIMALFTLTIDNLRSAQTVFSTGDLELARQMVETKVEVRRLERSSAERHIDRLRAGQRESLESSSLHLDLLRDLKRVNAHIASVAHPILDERGVLVESRLRPATQPDPAPPGRRDGLAQPG